MPRVCLSRNKRLDALIFAGISVLGVAALVAPVFLLSVLPPCLISLLTGLECWGCGITRAVLQALHGDCSAAWALNPLVFIVLPLLSFEYARLGWRLFGSVRKAPLDVRP
ncbi:DUF2752 domain-containing protein [Uliginosibacterium flavum]|uniref:DUF2752 domain-containing protein n=1 Tax=Uliginosibacterium flavum TaxID=1396831 RepID=A0ABV2TKV2_9RHOO